MKRFAKIKFWSFLIIGMTLILLGSYFLVTGNMSKEIASLLLFAGVIQLIIFYGLVFYLYKGKLKKAMKN